MMCPACPVVVGSVALGGATAFPVLPWVATWVVGGASLAYLTGMGVLAFTPWGISAVLTSAVYYAHKYEYLPAQNIGLDNNIRTFNSKKAGYEKHVCIEGKKKANILKSDSVQERHFYGKWGANVFKGDSDYTDNFYFSLCTTDLTNAKKNAYDLIWSLDLWGLYDFLTTSYRYAPTIHNFDDMRDKIRIFCSKHSVFLDQVHVSYNQHINATVVTIDVPYWRDGKIPYLDMDFTFLHNTVLESFFYEELVVLVEGEHQCMIGDNPSCLELNIKFSDICG